MRARSSIYRSRYKTERSLPPTRFGNPQYTYRCSVRCQKENVKYGVYWLTGFTSFVSCNTHASSHKLKTELKVTFPLCSGNDVGRDSVVRTTIRYEVVGPGIESRLGGGQDFPTPPVGPWGPPSLLYNGYRVSFPCVKRPGRDVDHPPHLAPRLKKE